MKINIHLLDNFEKTLNEEEKSSFYETMKCLLDVDYQRKIKELESVLTDEDIWKMIGDDEDDNNE